MGSLAKVAPTSAISLDVTINTKIFVSVGYLRVKVLAIAPMNRSIVLYGLLVHVVCALTVIESGVSILVGWDKPINLVNYECLGSKYILSIDIAGYFSIPPLLCINCPLNGRYVVPRGLIDFEPFRGPAR